MIFELHKHNNILYKRLRNEIVIATKLFYSSAVYSKNTFVIANHKNNSPVKYIPNLDSAHYILENGLRKVKPYYFEYIAHVKERWIGRPLLEVLTTDFRDCNEAYFKKAIENGFITINNEKVTIDTLFKKNDKMEHKVHRHEPPIPQHLEIIHQDNNLLVINKPGGVSPHPAGRYRHNTVLHLLKKLHHIPRLHLINRLDRLTSGLMLFGLNTETTKKFHKEMNERQIKKEYVCRVDGEFPKDPIICEAPIAPISYKFSFQYVDFSSNNNNDNSSNKKSRQCATLFERLSYNGRTSVVKCQPITGRTHQIRVHLRYLGYPICNDPIYGRLSPWSEFIDKMDVNHPHQSIHTQLVIDKMLENTTFDTLEWDGQPRCHECRSLLVPDPLPSQPLGIWLHSKKYSGPDWSFETDIPHWAHDDFNGDINIKAAYM
ncbi:unnamed protein product [Cunninghamella blakesleeana]